MARLVESSKLYCQAFGPEKKLGLVQHHQIVYKKSNPLIFHQRLHIRPVCCSDTTSRRAIGLAALMLKDSLSHGFLAGVSWSWSLNFQYIVVLSGRDCSQGSRSYHSASA